MEQNDAQPEDFLASQGIQVETPIEETVLTAGAATQVRFRAVRIPNSSKTYGYVFNEVDKFLREIVTPSLHWYQKTLHERDLDVYKLATEIDRQGKEIKELAKEYESLKYNYQLQKRLSTGQDDSELILQVKSLQEENEQLRLNGGNVENGVSQQDYLTLEAEKNALENHILQLEAYIEQIRVAYEELEQKVTANDDLGLPAPETALENLIPVEEYNKLEQEIAELKTSHGEEIATLQRDLSVAKDEASGAVNSAQKVSELETTISELDAHIATITTQYEALSNQYTTDVTTLQTELEKTKNDLTLANNNAQQVASLEVKISELETDLNGARERYETLSNKYTSDLADAQKETENVLAQLSQAQSELAVAVAAGDTTQLETQISELTAGLQQYSEQYEALSNQYTTDVTALQTELEQAKDTSEKDKQIAELSQYATDLDAYAKDVVTQYETLKQEVENTANNPAEIGQLRVQLAAAEAENARLTSLLEQQLPQKVEQSSSPRLPLLTETKHSGEDDELPPEFKNLPPGIRPDDL